MLTITLRGLQWRARRFGLGVAATALVFAMALLLAGVAASFRDEIVRTVDAFDGDRWVVLEGASGPFTAASTVSEAVRVQLRFARGVEASEPIATFRHSVRDGRDEHAVNVVAAVPGGMFRPEVVEGRAIRRAGEAVVDDATGIALGRRVTVGDIRMTVVGRTHGLTYFAGRPVLAMALGDGRRLAYDGAPLASAILTRGVPRGPLPGLKVMDPAAVRADLSRPMSGATTTIAVLGIILAFVAAGIIGLMTYLSGLDRLVAFAVFKTIGARTGRLLLGLILQGLLLAVGAAALAAGIALALAPTMAIGVQLSAAAFLGLLGLAVAAGLVISLVSVRQATSIDPAIAFGSN